MWRECPTVFGGRPYETNFASMKPKSSNMQEDVLEIRYIMCICLSFCIGNYVMAIELNAVPVIHRQQLPRRLNLKASPVMYTKSRGEGRRSDALCRNRQTIFPSSDTVLHTITT